MRLLGGTDPIGYAKVTNVDPNCAQSHCIPHVSGTSKLLHDESELFGTDD